MLTWAQESVQAHEHHGEDEYPMSYQTFQAVRAFLHCRHSSGCRIGCFFFLFVILSLFSLTPAVAATAPVLSLTDCIDLARRQNPQLLAARQEAAAQRIQADRERPSFRPNVALNLEELLHVPQVDKVLGETSETVKPFARTRLALRLEQPLFHAGASAAGQRADALDRSADAGSARAEADLILGVKRAYFGLLAAEQFAQVANEAVKLAEAHHDLVRTMLDAGSAARSDLLRADVEAAEARHEQTRAANGVDLARAALNRLLGRTLDTPIQLKPVDSLPPEPPALDELVQQANRNRPELQALQAQITAAEAGLSLARDEKKPSVNLTASLSQQTESAFVPSTLLLAGVVLRWPLLDGGQYRRDAQEAEARLIQLRALHEDAVQGVTLDVRRAWLALRESRQRAQVEAENVTAAREAADIAELRYQAGAGTNLETIDARLTRQRAGTNHAQALYDAHIAQAELMQTIGGEQ